MFLVSKVLQLLPTALCLTNAPRELFLCYCYSWPVETCFPQLLVFSPHFTDLLPGAWLWSSGQEWWCLKWAVCLKENKDPQLWYVPWKTLKGIWCCEGKRDEGWQSAMLETTHGFNWDCRGGIWHGAPWLWLYLMCGKSWGLSGCVVSVFWFGFGGTCSWNNFRVEFERRRKRRLQQVRFDTMIKWSRWWVTMPWRQGGAVSVWRDRQKMTSH